MERLYWNTYQKEMDSPFENTGTSYSNDVFKVKAYNWNDDSQPNFVYKGLEIYWYKHMLRGMVIKSKDKLTFKFLSKMIRDCMNSMEKDFKKRLEDKEKDDNINNTEKLNQNFVKRHNWVRNIKRK